MDSTYAVFVETENGGMRLVKTGCTTLAAMDYVWDAELNTEKTPIHIYNEQTGNEIEW